MLHCFIGSLMDSLRANTIRLALRSIDMAARQAGETVCIHLSYNESNGYVPFIENYHPNTDIKTYPQKESLSQFQHIKFILDNNFFGEDDWVMFHDDDDISLINRITVFRKNCSDCDVFRAKLVRPYTANIYESYKLPSEFDFGCMFSKVKVLREFFLFKHYPTIKITPEILDYTISSRACDCIFTGWITRSNFVTKSVDDVTYIAFYRDASTYFRSKYLYAVQSRFM